MNSKLVLNSNRHRLLQVVAWLAGIGCIGIFSRAFAADEALVKPATTADAVRVLDFSDFPLMEGAELSARYRLAGLSYQANASVKQALEHVHNKLIERLWTALPGGYISIDTASQSFKREGFHVSVSVSAAAKPGKVNISVVNYGNLDLKRVPVPKNVKPLYSGPFSEAYVTQTKVDKTTGSIRKLLQAKGWQPYGTGLPR